MVSLPNRLREIRERRGLSQQALADRILSERDLSCSQQQVDRHEKLLGKLKDNYLRAYAAVLKCAEQDIIGPPTFPSLFGYAQPPGEQGTLLDEALLTRVLAFIEDCRSEVGELAAGKQVTLVSVIYGSAIRDAVAAGVPPSQIDLERYRSIVQLAA